MLCMYVRHAYIFIYRYAFVYVFMYLCICSFMYMLDPARIRCGFGVTLDFAADLAQESLDTATSDTSDFQKLWAQVAC